MNPDFWKSELKGTEFIKIFFDDETNELGLLPSENGDGFKVFFSKGKKGNIKSVNIRFRPGKDIGLDISKPILCDLKGTNDAGMKLVSLKRWTFQT